MLKYNLCFNIVCISFGCIYFSMKYAVCTAVIFNSIQKRQNFDTSGNHFIHINDVY